ncbi:MULTISPECIES: phosphotransferase family protein [Vibrio]|uniref:phosphotransferase family protein n=1 Tax=Vibrio TaxID=662 RepID=UPI002075C27C|nr:MULTISPECIES: hypothetical protein [Vibrio]USD35220.1 hypothetical protein J8Z27_18185 [Vibrio sp. SCSIO 43186]USD48286.1 hypothetical protein J4N38_18580 [Vibrio sp. SCSIO 43145]USD72345.1 hypothetical protein J4N41_18195 [Vibrio sp. SCSIO 43139]USD98022.1 hypothetical protein CTT30_18390 [Vibrio coralliilyticus]
MKTEQEMAQMGAAKVHLIEKQGQQYIRKQGVNAIERSFYLSAAEVLSQQGVKSPRLITADEDSIVIEYVPHSVTLEELVNASEPFKQIAAIHQTPVCPDWQLKSHCWSDNAMETSLAMLSLTAEHEKFLGKLHSQSDVIFENPTLLSGDTNDGNWGRRENGEWVLFDWERFSTGSPAIDLAPLVKGLGDKSDMLRIVDTYLSVHQPMSREALLKQLIIAKAWLVIEVTNLLYKRKKPQLCKYIDWFNLHLPRWITNIEALI